MKRDQSASGNGIASGHAYTRDIDLKQIGPIEQNVLLKLASVGIASSSTPSLASTTGLQYLDMA